MTRLHSILVSPLETEKSVKGQAAGVYTFIVQRDATKSEIAAAVEKYYGVKVKAIRTSVVGPKTRTIGRGRLLVKRPLSKKAVITTEGGKTIDANKITV
jgi:large subunit ribosomal protein L23